MSVPATTVTAYFDLSATGGDYFTLDDATKGPLDGVTYKLAGTVATDISAYVRSVTFSRGRSRVLDEFTAGTCTIVLSNQNRTFDPLYTAGPYYGNIAPGKKFAITTLSSTTFTGIVEDWNFSYDVGGESVATVTIVDALAQLGAMEFDAWTTTAQLPGARMTAILDRPEVNFPANRYITTGITNLQADSVSWGSNVLNYMQTVAKTDGGRLYGGAGNGGIIYKDRYTANLEASSPWLLIADDGTGVAYQAIDIQYGSELLFNRVSVDRVGGTKQTATNVASQAAYGVRSLSMSSMLQTTDGAALDLATWTVGVYAQPQVRIVSVSFQLGAIDTSIGVSGWVSVSGRPPTDQQGICMADIGNAVTVTFTPNRTGSPIVSQCMIEGISHDIRPGSHIVTLRLSDIAAVPFTLNSSTLGVLDTSVLSF